MSNPIGRRGILGLIMGAGATAAVHPRVTLAEASAAIGLPVGATISETAEALTSVTYPGVDNGFWQIINLIEQDQYKRRTREVDMPPHIAGKKSWSRNFKSHVFAQEQRIFDAHFAQLRNSEDMRAKTMALFGLKVPEVE